MNPEKVVEQPDDFSKYKKWLDEPVEIYGDVARLVRRTSNMTQIELARLSGKLTLADIRRIESKEKIAVTKATALNLALTLGVKVESLIVRIDNQAPPKL